MRVCVLNPSYEDSVSPTEDYDSTSDPSIYMAGHSCEVHMIRKSTAVQQVRELARRDFDVFLNLCDGASDEQRPGIEVIRALEDLAVPFTGATSAFFEPTRQMMKSVCHDCGIAAPAGASVADAQNVEQAAASLRFPLIVKHPNSYGSIGLTRDSRVETIGQLRMQTARMVDLFGGALVEEFIEGREFTVLVAENPDDPSDPVTYVPVEASFPRGETFKHFALKWIDYNDMTWKPCYDRKLARRLRTMSKKLFVGLDGAGYARCDIRMDRAGELYMLEINPNCGIFYPPDEPGSADMILLHDPAGHKGFVRQILRAAVVRQVRQQQPELVRQALMTMPVQ